MSAEPRYDDQFLVYERDGFIGGAYLSAVFAAWPMATAAQVLACLYRRFAIKDFS
jgi:hypothetical protein